jgi:uncharacterized metal-binding protein YceD (DUF177 family)
MYEAEPFSRVVRVDAIPKEGQSITIEANAAERRALAALYKLPAIAVLSASLSVNREAGGVLRVTGAVHGELTQICVVSLDPFPATVDEDIDVRFAPRSEGGAPRRPSEAPHASSTADEDEPDPIVEGKIDLGALAAEFLALGLDPYPRKPGATFDPPHEPSDEDSPFAALRRAGQSHSD